jgi:hypothetical protein
MKHLLSTPPAYHIVDNMLETTIEEWNKSESNVDEYLTDDINIIYSTGTEYPEK